MGIGLIRFEICLVLILFSVSLLNFLKVITSDQVDKSYTLNGVWLSDPSEGLRHSLELFTRGPGRSRQTMEPII